MVVTADLLRLDDLQFLKAMSYTICGAHPVNNAYVLVAYQNLIPLMEAEPDPSRRNLLIRAFPQALMRIF